MCSAPALAAGPFVELVVGLFLFFFFVVFAVRDEEEDSAVEDRGSPPPSPPELIDVGTATSADDDDDDDDGDEAGADDDEEDARACTLPCGRPATPPSGTPRCSTSAAGIRNKSAAAGLACGCRKTRTHKTLGS